MPFESGYYPPGAEFDPSAPWNEQEQMEVSVDVEYSCTLTHKTTIETYDYDIEENGYDENGYFQKEDWSNTDWLANYHDCCKTPLELIKILKDVAVQKQKEENAPNAVKRRWKHIEKMCEGWTLDEEDAWQDYQ